MDIPRVWANASAEGRPPDGRSLPVSIWGWGDDDASATEVATSRLQRVLDRIRRGEPFPDPYGYGSRPLREEIVQTFDGPTAGQPAAIVTRNAYGAQVLNAAGLLFLDIDVEPASGAQRLLRAFGGAAPADAVLARLRGALQEYGGATFRVYRTASGFRAAAVDREFDPAGDDVQRLMQATGTDPAFARLCLAQRSFRARLTPKPWRCGCPLPPGRYPLPDDDRRQRFAAWLRQYERASAGYATCRYVETIGAARSSGTLRPLLELHDRLTRCDDALPLA